MFIIEHIMSYCTVYLPNSDHVYQDAAD